MFNALVSTVWVLASLLLKRLNLTPPCFFSLIQNITNKNRGQKLLKNQFFFFTLDFSYVRLGCLSHSPAGLHPCPSTACFVCGNESDGLSSSLPQLSRRSVGVSLVSSRRSQQHPYDVKYKMLHDQFYVSTFVITDS